MFHAPHCLYALKMLTVAPTITPKNNHCAAVIVERSPNPVAVVFADGLRQPITWAVKIHCRCLAPAIGKDGSAGALFRRQAVVNLCHFFHHLLPAKLIGIPLRQRAVLLVLDLSELEAK